MTIHKRPMQIFQGVVVLILGLGQGISRAEGLKPLRFGDPESSLMTEEEVVEVVKEEPEMQPNAEKSSLEKGKFSKVKDPGERVRKIIQSVLPGNAYPKEFEEIVGIGAPAIPTLIEIFQDVSASWQSRWIAAMALGRLGEAKAWKTLKAGLKDPLFLIRMASVQALGNTKDPSVAPIVRKVLNDKAMVVRSVVVDTLARLRDTHSVEALMEELHLERNFHRGQSLWIREKILEALGLIGDERAVPTLLSVLNEKEGKIRIQACKALERILPNALDKESKGTQEDCGMHWLSWRQKQLESSSASSQTQP